MQCHPDRQIISGSVIRKNVRTCSSDSLTASFANKMFTYSVNGVNKILLTLGPMAIVESDMSLMGLNILMQVLLTCMGPGDCEFGTCCVWTIRDEIATELRTN